MKRPVEIGQEWLISSSAYRGQVQVVVSGFEDVNGHKAAVVTHRSGKSTTVRVSTMEKGLRGSVLVRNADGSEPPKRDRTLDRRRSAEARGESFVSEVPQKRAASTVIENSTAKAKLTEPSGLSMRDFDFDVRALSVQCLDMAAIASRLRKTTGAVERSLDKIQQRMRLGLPIDRAVPGVSV